MLLVCALDWKALIMATAAVYNNNNSHIDNLGMKVYPIRIH